MKIHFIGIGGISMSGLAIYCLSAGFYVSGSDICENTMLENLRNRGVKIYNKHSKANIKDVEIIVYSSAITENNEEIIEAKKEGKLLLSRGEFLGFIANGFQNIIAVSGSHGKTTTTGMIAHIFQNSALKPTVHLGGEDRCFGNFLIGDDKYFITEACEYRKNFRYLKSDLGIILNMDLDHVDCYKNKDEIVSAFNEFANNSIYVIMDKNDKDYLKIEHLRKIFINDENGIFAKNISVENGKYSYDLFYKGKNLTRINLNVYGKYNICNSLFAIASGLFYGLEIKRIKDGIESFEGIKRRFEHISKLYSADVICDYAHTPKEIKGTIETAKKLQYKKLHLLFQPHTYSRTEAFLNEFIDAFLEEENVIIYKTYSAREDYNYKGSAEFLFKKLNEKNTSSVYIESEKELEDYLSGKLQNDELLLVLGAGNIYDIIKKIISKK